MKYMVSAPSAVSLGMVKVLKYKATLDCVHAIDCALACNTVVLLCGWYPKLDIDFTSLQIGAYRETIEHPVTWQGEHHVGHNPPHCMPNDGSIDAKARAEVFKQPIEHWDYRDMLRHGDLKTLWRLGRTRVEGYETAPTFPPFGQRYLQWLGMLSIFPVSNAPVTAVNIKILLDDKAVIQATCDEGYTATPESTGYIKNVCGIQLMHFDNW